MSESYPKLSEIQAIVDAAAFRVIAALKADPPKLPPEPAPQPVPVSVMFGMRGPGPSSNIVTLGESRLLFASCRGFDPQKTEAQWFDPDGEPIKQRYEVLKVDTLEYGPHTVVNVLAEWTPTRPYPQGSFLVFRSGIDDPRYAEMRLPIEVQSARPQPQPFPAVVAALPLATKFARPSGWPADWPPLGEHGEMPRLPEARDEARLVLLARYGYERDGSPMRGARSLEAAHAEVDRIAAMVQDDSYYESRYEGITPELACYGVLVGRIQVHGDDGYSISLDGPHHWTGVLYPSLAALLDREVDMFGSGGAGPGGR